MSTAKVRIRLKSYDHRILDNAVTKIVETIKRSGGEISGPVPLPTEIEKFTILRAVHKYKDSREQFEMRTHKRLIDIKNPSKETIDALAHLDLPSGEEIIMKGILGKKVGMTQVFTKNGKLIPVTVIEVEPNVVTQIKTVANDGYDAIQLATETIRKKSSNKPAIGHTKKAGTEPKRFLKEIRGVNVEDYTLGQVINVDIFEEGEMVDVSGISKGKGFQGVIKRHNQRCYQCTF